MRSIALKLTLLFLLVSLTGAFLVAVLLRQSIRAAFDQFIITREEQALADALQQYYQTRGSWEGVRAYLEPAVGSPDRPFPGGRDFHHEGMQLTLVGPDRTVLFSSQPNQNGQPVAKNILDGSVALNVGGNAIGWLIVNPDRRDWLPTPSESIFLSSVNHAALVSALVAASLAILLGGILAFTLTRSLRELTVATEQIAQGQLGGQVKVRSKDELGELAASFNKMSADLERAIQARRQMTADVAHDLRTPLSVISGYAEALSDGKLPGTPEVYDILHRETQHLSRLIDDLRTLSLADAGELQVNLQATEPRTLLERVAARHAVAAGQKGIALKVESEQDLPPVLVDPERMAQVLDNLLSNAFRYTAAGGEVVLAAKAREGEVQLQVRDTGSGVDPQDLPHIFDRFYRGDKSRSSGDESGLGLAISKSIVELHGGSINVESAPGQETSFTIHLKANPPDEAISARRI